MSKLLTLGTISQEQPQFALDFSGVNEVVYTQNVGDFYNLWFAVDE